MVDRRAEPADFARVHDVASEADTVAAVRACVADGLGMLATGGALPTHALPGDLGNAVISVARMNRILEHEVQDLTVTCEAGCTVEQVSNAVAAHGRRLALEVPDPSRYTIGGVIAARCDGFLRAACFGVRDQILGMRVVLSTGEPAATGGRVVKNVTGYDLAKLYCGSHGSLGIITSVTLRLRAMPPARRTFAVDCTDREAAFAAALALRDLTVTCTALVVVGGTARPPGRGAWSVLIRAEGRKSALDDAEASITRLAAAPTVVAEADAAALWSGLLARPAESVLAVRVDLPPSRCLAAAAWLQRAAADTEFGLIADVASGRVEFLLSRVLRDVDTTCGELMLGRLTRDLDAGVSLPHDPFDLVERFNRVGAPSPLEIEMARRVKGAFDPAGLMARGRHFKEMA